jgi:PIN domain nuclease of toxin-antitoxin system
MRVLLDTHLFVWFLAGSPKLGRSARKTIEGASAVFVSSASVWEIAIKAALGKIEADAAVVAEEIEGSGFIELPVSARHAARVAELPPLHGDPFDRLLIAQALCEPLIMLTADAALARYGSVVMAIGR